VSSDNGLVSTGNAVRDGDEGWFAGQFIASSRGLIHQPAVEIKWAQHIKGERRPEFAQWPHATTISILVQGSFAVRVKLPDGIREIILAIPGDYVAYGPIEHSWEALEDCLIITVRFPSLDRRSDDQT
jgi:hypothetical protein